MRSHMIECFHVAADGKANCWRVPSRKILYHCKLSHCITHNRNCSVSSSVSALCSPYTVCICMNVFTHAPLLLSVYVISGGCVAITSLAAVWRTRLWCVQAGYGRLET